MTTNQGQVASQIISTLRLTEPELDTSVGTPTRKIIDAVSEAISEAYIDQHMLTYQYDIDAKTGADLDDFVQLFGMTRYAAKRASGTVVFTRASGSSETTSVFIPVHTQIRSNTDPQVVVQTVTGAFMEPGALSVTVPVQAVNAGPEGNLAANTLVNFASPAQGLGSATNVHPLSGGTHPETDDELRARWKKTVFRSLAGTEQMYLGIALDDVDCHVANVVGASKKRREQVQVVNQEAVCTVDDAAYVYYDPVFVGESIDAGDIYIRGNDYSWINTSIPPKVTVLNSEIADDTMLEVDFEYMPKSSRNDPTGKITNRVDVWVGGQRARAAVQSAVFRTNLKFIDTAPLVTEQHLFNRHDFRRPDGTKPSDNNFFVPLAFGPILTVPPTLSIGGQVYAKVQPGKPFGTEETIGGENVVYAYEVVHDDTAYGYSPVSRFGLEWYNGNLLVGGTAAPKPANNKVFTLGGQSQGDYTYNSMITTVQDNINRWRLVGIDAKVHQAKQIELRFSIAIMYSPRVNRTQVDSSIDTAVADWLTGVGFQGRVQMSDILQVIHNVTGVDNVRFLHGGEEGAPASSGTGQAAIDAAFNPHTVGVQQMVNGAATKSFVDTSGRPRDLRFGDNELPIFHSMVKVLKAENSFGSL